MMVIINRSNVCNAIARSVALSRTAAAGCCWLLLTSLCLTASVLFMCRIVANAISDSGTVRSSVTTSSAYSIGITLLDMQNPINGIWISAPCGIIGGTLQAHVTAQYACGMLRVCACVCARVCVCVLCGVWSGNSAVCGRKIIQLALNEHARKRDGGRGVKTSDGRKRGRGERGGGGSKKSKRGTILRKNAALPIHANLQT